MKVYLKVDFELQWFFQYNREVNEKNNYNCKFIFYSWFKVVFFLCK